MNLNEIIGERIRLARTRKDWNQSDLARAVHKPRQHISQVEQGKQQPRAELLIDIADALGVTTRLSFRKNPGARHRGRPGRCRSELSMPLTVRDVLRRLRQDGWYQVKSGGSSHRQFKHPTKSGRVTVAGHAACRRPPQNPPKHLAASWAGRLKDNGMEFAVIFEHGPTSVGAYVPDLPGCVAVGATMDEARQLIQDAIALHLAGMLEDGVPLPTPASHSAMVTVPVSTPSL